MNEDIKKLLENIALELHTNNALVAGDGVDSHLYHQQLLKSWTNPIDYSELVTEPDCVLSMREIYNKYVVTGNINGISGTTRPLTYSDPSDEYADTSEFEEDIDLLRVAKEVEYGQRTMARINDLYTAAGAAVASENESAPTTKNSPNESTSEKSDKE